MQDVNVTESKENCIIFHKNIRMKGLKVIMDNLKSVLNKPKPNQYFSVRAKQQ